MPSLNFFTYLTSYSLLLACCVPVFAGSTLLQDQINQKAQGILQKLSLEEKIGQKLMMDFRYWCPQPPDNSPCTYDMTEVNQDINNIMSKNHIGGVILFSNNLKNIPQIITLTSAFQKNMSDTGNLGLLIATDQEGGIIFRLPADAVVTFPGNMALAAASFNHPEYAAEAGKTIGTNLKAVGINVDFAPDVDVNVNPLNPIINVRSFSDDPERVTALGLAFSAALQQAGIAVTLKHFPGHGDTITDSHIGLPVVNHSLQEAEQVDLYPFKNIIIKNSPDFIMTAHIQFPALDNSQIYSSKMSANIITPATLSHKIQHDILRNELGYDGIVVTDALNMGAITQNFEPIDTIIKVFQAGNDIALMPITVSQPAEANQVGDLIARVVAAVNDHTLSLDEINQSVLRILKVKIKMGLLDPDPNVLSDKLTQAEAILSDPKQRELEASIANAAVTLVQNNNALIPITLLPGTRIHILTPWLEQGAGIAHEIEQLQKENKLPENLQVSFFKMTDTGLDVEKKAIDNADIVIIANSTQSLLSFNAVSSLPSAVGSLNLFAFSTLPPVSQGTLAFPDMPEGDTANTENINSRHAIIPSSLFAINNLTDSQFAYQALQYAKQKGKKTIFISLRAPYDLPNYRNVADAMLAVYDFYGYLTDGSYYRGPMTPALTRVIFGFSNAAGKLPINVPDPDSPGTIVYSRGFHVH